jgi:catechol 2,3-dioxygenase-like lactoylglutathione lyase family enzyme
MDWKFEVVVIPVSDVDRAKQFYSEQLGFNVDVDNRLGESFRNVQLTPRARRARSPLVPGSRQAYNWSLETSRPLEPNWGSGVLRSARSSALRRGSG